MSRYFKSPFLLLFFAPLVFFGKVIFIDRFAYSASELLTTYIPNYVFMSASWRAGSIPLWHPYHHLSFIGVGFPGVFYPFNILISLILDPQGNINNFYNAVIFLEIIHYLASSIFMYLLMRKLNVNKIAAFFSAVAFAYSPYFIGPLDNPCFVFALTYYPLIFLFFLKGFNEKIIYGVFSGAFLGLTFLTGYLPVPVYAALSLIFYALFRVVTCKDSQRLAYVKRGVFCCVLTFSVAFLLGAAQLLPSYEYAKLTVRTKHTFDSITAWGSIPVFHLITFFMPYFFGGGTLHPQLWVDRLVEIPYNGLLYYAGILTLFMAAFSVLVVKDKRARFFAVLFLFSLFMILGKNAALFGMAYSILHLPLVRMPIKFGLFTTFSLCVLAGIGLDSLINAGNEKPESIRKAAGKILNPILICSFILLAVFLILRIIKGELPADLSNPMDSMPIRYATGVAVESIFRFILTFLLLLGALYFFLRRKTRLWLAALLALGILDVFIVSWQINPVDQAYVPEKIFRNDKNINFIKQDKDIFRVSGLDHPVGLVGDIAKIQHLGYTGGFAITRFAKFRGINDQNDPLGMGIGGHSWFQLRPDPRSQFIDLYNVKYLIFSEKDKKDYLHSPQDLSDYDAKYKKVPGFDDLYLNTKAFPRAFTVHTYRWSKGANPDQILEKMAKIDLAKEAIVEADIGDQAEEGLGDSVFIEKYTPREIKIKVEMKSAGLLVLSDIWNPGWQVYVDEKKSAILRTDYIFRGLLCGKGRHEVLFKYNPISVRLGMVLSLLGLGVISVVLIKLILQKRS